ncbi:hypothetical protein IAT38_004335 [Cryptococcus sp. DSM 104549]
MIASSPEAHLSPGAGSPQEPKPRSGAPQRISSNEGGHVGSSGAGLLSLPHEILEQLFFVLELSDRLKLSRTCSALRDTYSSAPLQYLSALETSAYLDIPPIPPSLLPAAPTTPLSSSSSPPSSPSTPPPTLAFRSPHTDNLRHAISSVSLAPWPKTAPETSPFDHPTSAAEKNVRLRDRETRWETMDWKEKRVFKVQGREGVYELQEGIFLMCDDFNDEDDEKPTTVRLIPLPSSHDPDLEDPPIQTKAHKVPIQIADLTMDPTQDLIVVSEYRPESSDTTRSPPTHRFHLLTMSNFQPHPLASLPTLDFPPFTQALMRTRQLLQVMGDTLAVLVAKYIPHWVLDGLGIGAGMLGGMGQEEEIVIWNWKTGRVLSRLSFPEKGWFSSFALLSPTTFMITATSNISPLMPSAPRSLANLFPPVIQIYSIAPDPSHTIIPVQPLDSDHMDDTTPRPVLLAQLEMPRFAPGTMVFNFDVRPDPPYPPRPRGKEAQAQAQANAGGPEPTLVKNKPFTQDPSCGILVFELKVQQPVAVPLDADEEAGLVAGADLGEGRFELFVPRETLVNMGKEGEARLAKAYANGGDVDGLGIRGVERTLAWEDWGEKGARIMDAVMRNRSWVCSCAGYRYISLWNADPPTQASRTQLIERPSRHDLLLHDFSPYAVRKERARQQAEAGTESPDERQGEESGEKDDFIMFDGGGDAPEAGPSRSSSTSSLSSLPSSLDSTTAPTTSAATAPSPTSPNTLNLTPEDLAAGSKSWLVDEPSVLPRGKFWKEDVKSGLPYRKVWRKYGGWANGVMVDDQRVIVICTSARRNGDWSSITQEMTVLCM